MKKKIKIIAILAGIGVALINVWGAILKRRDLKDADLIQDCYDGAGEAVLKTKKTIYEALIKRAIDVILSSAGILILSPVFLGLAIAIYIDDPGPILFTQKRVGLNKTFFKLYKFRSMKMSTPHDMPTHMLADPEQYITRVGKILRKYSLDELPQFYNILVGDISIVGPRPALWNQADLVAERDKYGANDVMPGLTGWAQINGRDELEIPVKAAFDGEYVEKLRNSSVSGMIIDLRCFFGTFLSVLKSDGVVEGGTGELNRKEDQKRDYPEVDSVIGFNEVVEVDWSKQKKVLITGANSYIGESFENYAKEKYPNNYEIDTLDMIDGSWREKDFSVYDTVFHVAGIAHADVGNVSEEVKEKYYAVNTDLAVETAEKAKADGVKQFVFMSSMIIYGESAPYRKEKMITAETKPEPANFYGDSKWQADKGVRGLADKDFNVLVIRPPMIYGKGSKGNYPLLAKFAKKLPVFPDVNNQRSMLYIENLCEFLCQVILIGKGGVFFPQNAEYTRTADMVKEISIVAGKKLMLTKGLNPFVWIAGKMPGKIGGLVNKAFGNMIYNQEMSIYSEIEYRVVGLKESIIRIDSVNKSRYKDINDKLENLEGKSVLLIALPGYPDGIVKKMKELGAEVEYIHDKPTEGIVSKTLGRLQFGFYQRTLNEYYRKTLEPLKERNFDFILVIRGEYTPKETLCYIRNQYPNAKLILYMWDGLNKQNTFGIEKKWPLFDRVYTFDRIDYEANKDELLFLPLYYYDEYLPQNIKSANDKDLKYDLSFIGTAHDDRIKIIKNVMEQVEKRNLSSYAYFFMPHRLLYVKNKLFNKNFKGIVEEDIHYEMIPFEKLYQVYADSKCVVDVENKGQHGLTMRSIEILGLRRKFITTNQDIVNYDFFNPDNIYILDRENPKIDCNFFDKPYNELPDEIYEKYSLKNWILEVLK